VCFEDPKILESFLQCVRVIFQSNGVEYTVKYIKEVRRVYTRWLCKIDTSSEIVSISSDGFPKKLGWDIRNISETLKGRALILTLLSLLRSFKGTGSGSSSQIESPYTGTLNLIDLTALDNFKSGFLRYLKTRPHTGRKEWESFALTTKNGPNGHAITTAFAELQILSDERLKDIQVLAGEKLKTRICSIQLNLGPYS